MSKGAADQALSSRQRRSMPENTHPSGSIGSTQPNEWLPPPYVQAQQPNQVQGSGRNSNGAFSLPPQSAASAGSSFKKLIHAVGDHTFRSGKRKSMDSAKHAFSGLFRRSSRESILENPPERSLPARREERSSSDGSDQARAYLEIDTDSSGSGKKDTSSKDELADEFAYKSSARLASASFLDSDSNDDPDDDPAVTTGAGREATFTA
ncbi:hypothetical protein H4S07_003134, partial [Coemansia furcata]